MSDDQANEQSVTWPLEEQPVRLESLPTESMARMFQGECFKAWADVADFPPGGFLAYPGVGRQGFHWIQHELRRRSGGVKYVSTGVQMVPRFGRGIGRVSARVMPLEVKAGVYFIQCGPFVKIGLARNIRFRFKSLQQIIPFQLELLGAFAPAEGQSLRDLERSFHQRFCSVHQCGEWYRLEGELDVFCLSLARGEAVA